MNNSKINKLIKIAQQDENIIGLIPTGSFGKGFQTKNSDFDCIVIVKDNFLKEYSDKYKNFNKNIDLNVLSLAQFDKYAEWGSESEWDRYNFAHIRALVDKTNGKIQKLIDKKSVFPKDKARDFIKGNLDAYINQVYRSLKNFRDGNKEAGTLDAIDTIRFVISIIFALHGRIRPYNKYLFWEIEKYPLTKISWKSEKYKEIFINICSSGDIDSQKELFKMIKDVSCQEGFGDVFDAWGDKLFFF